MMEEQMLVTQNSRSHDSPKANPRWETQSQLAQGQPRAKDTVMTRPRPTSGERGSHDSLEAKPRREMQSRLT
jgi:hypothetical protein